MLLRLVIKNLYSFDSETEFNMYPSKGEFIPLAHHKGKLEEIEFLRFAAIYGANAAGKSNIIKSLVLLKDLLLKGTEIFIPSKHKFQLVAEKKDQPSKLGIEFISGDKIFYYELVFDEHGIQYEILTEELSNNISILFERGLDSTKATLSFSGDNNGATETIRTLLKPTELLLSLLGDRGGDEYRSIKTTYKWLVNQIIILQTDDKTQALPYTFYKELELNNFAKKLFSNLNLGPVDLVVNESKLPDSLVQNERIPEGLRNEMAKLKDKQDGVVIIESGGIESNIAYENGNLIQLRLTTNRKDNTNNDVIFDLTQESDGTRRLIDFLPLIYDLYHNDKVYVIDEIERSLHPIMVIELLEFLSQAKVLKGQLIFTTHETSLLRSSLFRPDEIWLAEKSPEGSTHLYPLSDYELPDGTDLEQDYVDGRFGAIPFLGGLKKLKWA